MPVQSRSEPLAGFSPYVLLTRPEETHRLIRAEPPVRLVREESGFTYFLVSGHAEARRALRDPRLSNDPRRLGHASGAAVAYSPMANDDPPAHTRLRRLVSHGFTRRRIAALEPRIERTVAELLDAVTPAGHADLIADFAFPLPVLVISELLGIPTADRPAFRTWASRTLSVETGPRTRDERSRRLRAYFGGLVEEKRAGVRHDVPADEQPDLLSALLVAQEDGGLSDEELVGLAMLVLVAGHETTTNLIGNGLLTLLAHPDQFRELREDPALLPGAVEELLRFEGSAGQSSLRVAVEDVELGGTLIPEGSVVNVGLSLANRDPDAFGGERSAGAGPDRFDIRRAPNPHLAFGHGIHFCLGAPLARALASCAFAALFARLPGLALDVPPAELRWRQISILCGLTRLPVSFRPGPGPAGRPEDRPAIRSEGASAE
ncbi:cytochrome P450 family protein [Streptomyces formicae]|uniref:Putative cytochrome P450 hydroxylase n=1 Tax=Streptomyces formicae TaxID=1616117 RepID=A0A291Q6G5_9ACTN|nr:cytochrome P450 [Streptomyces formicae]ATL27321.1 putative cytochrome P450 hydroxylase [Streptomyces formicae]